jgi:hypothetical protein
MCSASRPHLSIVRTMSGPSRDPCEETARISTACRSVVGRTLLDLGSGYARRRLLRRTPSADSADSRRARNALGITRAVFGGYFTFIGVGVLIGYLYAPASRDSSLTTHLIAGGALGLAAAVLLLLLFSTAFAFVAIKRARPPRH